MAGIIFGLIPALRMSLPNLPTSLHMGSRSVAGRAGQFRISMMLVVGQIALSAIIIAAAGLVLRSFWNLSQVNPGFRTGRIVTAEVSIDAGACKTATNLDAGSQLVEAPCHSFFQALLDQLNSISGVESVALTNALPMNAVAGNYAFDAEGHPRDAREGALIATMRTVSPGFFPTLGLSAIHGRLLDEQDASGSSHAAVVNETLAQRLWPNQNPLGRHILDVKDEDHPAVWNKQRAVVVVGVVGNTHERSLAEGFGDQIYLPMTPANQTPSVYVMLRTRTTAQEAAARLRRAVTEANAEVAVTRIRSLDEVVASSTSSTRSLSVLLLVFAGLAGVIGSIGVYSLIAYIVSWRMREFGIRLALGAQRWQIIRDVQTQSLSLSLAGSVLGLAVAAFAGQILRRFLFGVAPTDVMTFAVVAILLSVISLVAAGIPARRAASVDPIKILRAE